MGYVAGLTKRPIRRSVEFLIKGGEASIAFPIGPTLIQYGAKAQDFVTMFNNVTKGLNDFVFPVEVIIYKSGGLDLFIRTPATARLFDHFKYYTYGDNCAIRRTDIYNIAKIKAFDAPFSVLRNTYLNLQY
jgi:ribosomal protein L11